MAHERLQNQISYAKMNRKKLDRGSWIKQSYYYFLVYFVLIRLGICPSEIQSVLAGSRSEGLAFDQLFWQCSRKS